LEHSQIDVEIRFAKRRAKQAP